MEREALMVYEKHAEEDEAVKHRLVDSLGRIQHTQKKIAKPTLEPTSGRLRLSIRTYLTSSSLFYCISFIFLAMMASSDLRASTFICNWSTNELPFLDDAFR